MELLDTFFATTFFCISTWDCWAMLENGTSTEYLMLWSSWITMLDTILNDGRRLPPLNMALRTYGKNPLILRAHLGKKGDQVRVCNEDMLDDCAKNVSSAPNME